MLKLDPDVSGWMIAALRESSPTSVNSMPKQLRASKNNTPVCSDGSMPCTRTNSMVGLISTV